MGETSCSTRSVTSDVVVSVRDALPATASSSPKKWQGIKKGPKHRVCCLTMELSDAGGPARPNWQLTWPAGIRSSDFVRAPCHVKEVEVSELSYLFPSAPRAAKHGNKKDRQRQQTVRRKNQDRSNFLSKKEQIETINRPGNIPKYKELVKAWACGEIGGGGEAHKSNRTSSLGR